MIVAGCDVGSATGKALIVSSGEIPPFSIVSPTTKPEMKAQRAVNQVPGKAGLASDELDHVVVTRQQGGEQ